MFALALAATAVQPQPGGLKTFGDWAVGCDNVRACRAVALIPENDDGDRHLKLVIDRGGAPEATPILSFWAGDEPPTGPRTLRVDGQPVSLATGDRLPVNRALTSALVNGRRATLTDARGRTLASASLSGLAAASLYMDERQLRLGTASALRRTGPKPDSAVPAPPPLPRIVQPATSAKPPRSVSPKAAARLIGRDNAICDHAQAPVEPRADRLDPDHSLVLVEHRCGNGAYNIMTSVFIVNEAGRVTPATFDVPPGLNPEKDSVLVNGDWDTRARRLSEFPKARGLGDCGTLADYAWDGRRFRLVRLAQMDECRGSLDYITTWRAAVTTAR